MILIGSSTVWAQVYRDSLPLPSFEINRQLITYAQAMDHEKISATLSVMKPLTEVLKTKFGVDLESEIKAALAAGDQARLLKATQALIYLDIRDLLDEAKGTIVKSSDKTRGKMKAAYLNYLFLSPFIEKIKFSSDQTIKNHFRSVDLTLSLSSPYSRERTVGRATQERIRQLIGAIDEQLVATLAVPH